MGVSFSGFYGLNQSLSLVRNESASYTTSDYKKNNVAATKAGRFLVFPFTMYGPNVQLLGLKHALAVCIALRVQCVEPGFSDLFAQSFYKLGDFIDIESYDLLLPRSTLPSPLRPQVFLYGLLPSGEPRWPTPSYFNMHNITVHSAPPGKGYARTASCASQANSHAKNTHSTLHALRQELLLFQEQSQSEADHVVALVYSASLGDAAHHPQPPLTEPFLEVSRKLHPVEELQRKADEVLETMFPKGANFLAMHLRLKDHCKVSFEACCCETSGNSKPLTMFDVESFAEKHMRRHGTRYLFISGPPVLERMVEGWDWLVRNAGTVKLWYSKTAAGSLEESMVQQVICSKATAFFISVPSSTWSGSVILWQANSSAAAEQIVPERGHGPLLNFSSYSVWAPTEQHDTRLDLAYLPSTLTKISESESSFLRELEHRLEFTSTRSHCHENSTMFAMLRNDGLGASFHFVHLALGIAVAHGLSLVTMNMRPNGKWAWGTMCKSNDWQCLFTPTHSCIGLETKQQHIQKYWMDSTKPCPSPWCLTWSRRGFSYDMEKPLSLGIPIHGVSAVLYRAKLTQFLFQLNPAVQDRVDAQTFRFMPAGKHSTKPVYLTLQEVATSLLAHGTNAPPIIAMHVRQGDSCKDPRKIRKCFGLAEYMNAATKMQHLYGSDTIVIATDSAEVVANITADYKDWNWYFQNISRSKYDVKDEKEYLTGGNIPAKMLKSGTEDSTYIQIESVTDLFALSLGSAFVGTFTSDFSRLAFELVCARAADHVPPYVSLAGTFCKGEDPITSRPVYLCE